MLSRFELVESELIELEILQLSRIGQINIVESLNIKNYKLQIINFKQYRNSKLQCSKQVLSCRMIFRRSGFRQDGAYQRQANRFNSMQSKICFGFDFCNLRFISNLVLVICYFRIIRVRKISYPFSYFRHRFPFHHQRASILKSS